MSKSVFEASSNPGEAAWSAIGQYHDLITPLHACMIAACIANDGVMMEPKQLLSVSNSAGQSYALSPAVAATPLSDTDALKEMMVACVKSGTGTAAQIKGVTVGGKTGTAQVDGQEDTAWFVGFVEDEQHPLAVAVVMEQAGSGGRVAAPAAKKVLEKAMDLGY